MIEWLIFLAKLRNKEKKNKDRIEIERVRMTELDPEYRITNNEEVNINNIIVRLDDANYKDVLEEIGALQKAVKLNNNFVDRLIASGSVSKEVKEKLIELGLGFKPVD